ncbi:hypothetical protein KORDIASMS9_04163 [Kordia sp. SMS9]|uniref:hypothetical protein n=1 Tax=Kordia sp. SMS9 TaxID=2282170 RepID=UPI000E0CDB2B|nr:hypothetical protein [Kordia sp. SMS9]AXG71905.1 hypothetical protein KORDIASMS9_04163 [Kordia sp. SMS9]
MSSQEKNKQGKIIGFIVGAIVFGLVSFGLKSCFFGDVTTEMKKVVNEMNAETPTVIDEYTRLDSVALTGKKKFEYYYTIKGATTFAKSNTEMMRKTMKGAIITELKSNPDMNAFSRNNITLGYNYFNEQAELILDLEIKAEEYK